MSGYRSIVHQGFVAAKTAQGEIKNPYPYGSDASDDFIQGVHAFNRGDRIGKDGMIHRN